MPLLYRLRKSQTTSVKVILSLFTSAWLALALQPCAMAFDLPAKQHGSESKNNHHHNQTNAQQPTAPLAKSSSHCHQATTDQNPPPAPPCPHCFADMDSELCQADDWAKGKQTLQGFMDSKPATADRLVTTIPLDFFVPAFLGSRFEEQPFSHSQAPTPTTRQDISRC